MVVAGVEPVLESATGAASDDDRPRTRIWPSRLRYSPPGRGYPAGFIGCKPHHSSV
ncbi:hypothetical protein LU604_24265 [Erwinia tracheiphila]|uniref:hypothetical protein n=1 Tax=Erwinia tracheiphila TaxID=65700 RepID=UPI001F3B03E4|nr:hypothetical protein [Erwinia tracheiphila]UIA83370.1 hypothetical protein LU604_24265 [Erwinia tracheiphila]UIA91950.1 hypothetical protein LU632_23725 [Erwinia tracheiphila]